MGIIQREILSEAKLLLTQFRALCIVANPLLVYGGHAPVSLSSQLNAISWKEIGEL